MKNHTYASVRAVYHEGVLTVLDPLVLPDGTQVQLDIHLQEQKDPQANGFREPSPAVSSQALDPLTGIIDVGGDALVDSEAINDPDWD